MCETGVHASLQISDISAGGASDRPDRQAERQAGDRGGRAHVLIDRAGTLRQVPRLGGLGHSWSHLVGLRMMWELLSFHRMF